MMLLYIGIGVVVLVLVWSIRGDAKDNEEEDL